MKKLTDFEAEAYLRLLVKKSSQGLCNLFLRILENKGCMPLLHAPSIQLLAWVNMEEVPTWNITVRRYVGLRTFFASFSYLFPYFFSMVTGKTKHVAFVVGCEKIIKMIEISNHRS